MPSMAKLPLTASIVRPAGRDTEFSTDLATIQDTRGHDSASSDIFATAS